MDVDTTPQGYTARGRTHPGGVFLGAIGTQKICPPVTRHLSTRQWSTRHCQPGTGQPVTRQPITGQEFTGQPVTGQEFTGQPGTGQPVTSQSGTSQPGTGHLIPGISHQSSLTSHRSSSHRSLDTSQPTRLQLVVFMLQAANTK